MHRSTRFAASAALAAIFAALPGQAADKVAGGELAVECAACHGPAGISTSGEYPNLAGQKPAYIAAQLTAFRAEDRKNTLMNAIAASLSDDDIENLAAHFASLPGAETGNEMGGATDLDGTLMSFPEDLDDVTTVYHRKDFDGRKQVRLFRGNEMAIQAAKDGKEFPAGSVLIVEIYGAKTDDDGNLVKGDDGRLVQGDLAAYTAMEKQEGWGKDVPKIYDNGDWRYSIFTTGGSVKEGVNEAPCMACHKPLTDTDYSFTYDWMKDYDSAKEIGYTHAAAD